MNIRPLILFILFLGSVFCCEAQRDYTWCFGDSAMLHYNNGQMNVMPFSGINSMEASASISDMNGNLLFYAGGTECYSYIFKVWDNTHNVMLNGDSLFGYSSSTNGAIIVPFVGDSSKYYLFYHGDGISTVFMYYSIIDMGLNGGLGGVVQKNIPLVSLNMSEKYAAVKHGNGSDWWLVAHIENGSEFYKFLIDGSGINNPIIQSIGHSYTLNGFFGWFGEMTFSGNGRKLVAVSDGMIDYFDFDRCTGTLWHYLDLSVGLPSIYSKFYGVSFSQENGFLYASTSTDFPQGNNGRLYQFDLSALSNIALSRHLIYVEPNQSISFGQHQLAPDGKIYITMGYNIFSTNRFDSISMNLNSINDPDSLGVGCNFTKNTLFLNGHCSFFNLPNIPNYNLGALVGSSCDTLTVGINEIESAIKPELFVFYHPQWQTAFINAKSLKGKHYALHVYGITGTLVFKEQGNLNSAYFTKDLNMQGFASGVYVVSLVTDKEVLNGRFVKE